MWQTRPRRGWTSPRPVIVPASGGSTKNWRTYTEHQRHKPTTQRKIIAGQCVPSFHPSRLQYENIWHYSRAHGGFAISGKTVVFHSWAANGGTRLSAREDVHRLDEIGNGNVR